MCSLLATAQGFLFPEFCCHCQRLGGLLCENCYTQAEFAPPPDLNLSPSYLDEVYTCFNYSGPIPALIKSFKYQSVRGGAILGGELIYQHLTLPRAVVATGVPLHPRRHQERGFNQAELIGRRLARLLGLPYLTLLRRQVNSEHQARQPDRAHRLSHQRGHFAPTVRAPRCPGPVLLLDDVLTTGATLNECARTLKAVGWTTVYGVTLAHG